MVFRLFALFLLLSTASAWSQETPLITKIRQVTFEGKRAGEGYFSADGARMIFQSEREEGNPFYQMYLLDMETGDTTRVSPGYGKTTCGWVHPKGDKVMFSSTHEDPKSLDYQRQELTFRASGKKRRYSWDYDEFFEIYEHDLASGENVNLTNSKGYDAEGSYSPDGKLIAFASNRSAYTDKLSEEDKKLFAMDKSYLMDIYVMNADGSNVKRLTNVPGYDGGPFFSANGKKITWRRFATNGTTAEIFTMNVDGSHQKQITRLGVMSWAPFFHPSGDYLVFATNLHGMANFELYAVDAKGEKDPVRVTTWQGFDGLAAFSPNGDQITWSSKRSADKTSQIFLAHWNDTEARKRLGLIKSEKTTASTKPPIMELTKQEITAEDMRTHVAYLATEEMAGRLTGGAGERKAAKYVAGVFKELGLVPSGDAGDFIQAFDFTAGASLGKGNRLLLTDATGKIAYKADKDWRPLAFSKTGAIKSAAVVFAGYGIVTPPAKGEWRYDSYDGLDVKGKWALILRHMPENAGAKKRRRLIRFSDLQYKAAAARRKGALGVIIASGPNALVRLTFESAGGISGGGAVSVTNKTAQSLLKASGKSLKKLQQALDEGEAIAGFLIPGVKVSANIDIAYEKRRGHNVIGRIASNTKSGTPILVIGAHLDHLGRGEISSSLARGEEKGMIHFGADDNASGVAGLMEIAQRLAAMKAQGLLKAKRDIVFAAWSGEELGLLGSKHYTKIVADSISGDMVHPDGIHSAVAAYLNMDMIGRLEDKLYMQGVDSSAVWPREIERRNIPVGLPISISGDSYLPTDSTSFYLRNVPVLTAFTGAHSDYHTPRDTADKLNYSGAAKTAKLMANIALSLARSESVPNYVKTERPKGTIGRKNVSVYLGTIPDYAQENVKGVKISGTAKGGPAEKAGLINGDIIVGMGGVEISNIYEFVDAMGTLKANKQTDISIIRGENRIKLSITPAARE